MASESTLQTAKAKFSYRRATEINRHRDANERMISPLHYIEQRSRAAVPRQRTVTALFYGNVRTNSAVSLLGRHWGL